MRRPAGILRRAGTARQPEADFRRGRAVCGRRSVRRSSVLGLRRALPVFRRLDEHTAIVGGADRDESAAHAGGDPHELLRAFVEQRLGPSFDITHRWSGSLFETADGLPYIAAHPHHRDRVFFTTGLSGNGMVMGALAGRLLAGFATGAAESRLVPLFGLDRTGMKISEKDRPGVPTGSARRGLRACRIRGGCELSEVAPGSARCVTVGKTPLAIVNVDGRVFALDNRCTHAGGKMCEGDLDGTVIECPLHGSRFEVTTGAVVAGPARLPLGTHETRVDRRPHRGTGLIGIVIAVSVQIPRTSSFRRALSVR